MMRRSVLFTFRILASIIVGLPTAQAAEGFTAHYEIPTQDGRVETLTLDAVILPISDSGELESIVTMTDRTWGATDDNPWLFFSDSDRARSPASSNLFKKVINWAKGNRKPIEEITASEKDVSKIRAFANAVYQKPKRVEIALGLVQATWMGITSSTVFFTSQGLDPMVAAAAVAFRTALSVVHGIWGRTLDGLFTKSFHDPSKTISKTKDFFRRQFYSYVITNILRLITGPLNSAASALSGRGQLEILTYLFSMGVGSTMLHRTRAATMLDDPSLNARFSFMSFLMTAPVSLMDLAGMGKHVVIDLGYYQIKETNLAILGVYGALTIGLRVAPEFVKKSLYAPDAVWNKIRSLFGKRRVTLPASCGDQLKKESEPDIPNFMLPS